MLRTSYFRPLFACTFLIVCLAQFSGAPPVAAQPGGPANFIVEPDVEYGRAGDKPLLLDIVRPAKPADGPLPVVVHIHGGGWQGGNKASGRGQLAKLAETGNYFGVSIAYRFSQEARWPAQLHDCKAAIRWLRANAKKYNINPDKIGVIGISAGGHLVSMLGTTGDVKGLEGENGSAGQSSRVTCVVDICGPSDFLAFAKLDGHAPEVIQKLIGGDFQDKREVARQASPLTHVDKGAPPFLILHGTKDNLVPLAQAEVLHAALQKVGANPTFVRIEGGDHGIGGPEVAKRIFAFFEKHLRDQAVEVSAEPIEVRRPVRTK